MKLLTKDERLLTVLQIGELSKEGCSEEKGTTTIKCRTETGRKVTIQQDEVKCFKSHCTDESALL